VQATLALSPLCPLSGNPRLRSSLRSCAITGREQMQQHRDYSITSSARASTDGISSPSALAVFRLRHGCGYALANAGHDTRALQAWLGHKNIQHTVRYNCINECPLLGVKWTFFQLTTLHPLNFVLIVSAERVIVTNATKVITALIACEYSHCRRT